MSQNIQDKYDHLFRIHGISNQSLGWGEKERSNLRFKILTDQWNLSEQRILDFGCGFGALKDYLLASKSENFYYTGIDINKQFICTAADLNKYPRAFFMVRDILLNPLEEKSVDYAIVSGTFNDYRPDCYEFVKNILYELDLLTIKGIAVNFLSCYADVKYDHASYFDPSKILEIAYSISKNVLLRNDYMPYEFSIIINKNYSVDPKLTVYNNYLSFL